MVSRLRSNMTAYAIHIDWPPSANTHWRRAGHRIYLSPQGRQFRESVYADVMLACKGKPELLTGRLGVRLELTPPTHRKLDIDNRIKPTLDALEGLLFEDDEQIDVIEAVRLPVAKPGGCLVIVSELFE